jgi:WD40 repeat protein
MSVLLMLLLYGAGPHGGSIRVQIEAHEAGVTALVWSPDGKTVLSAGKDGAAVAWDRKTLREMYRVKIKGGKMYAAAYSPNGRYAAVAGSDGTVVVLTAKTGRVQQRLKGHEGPVACLAFSPDGKTLVSGGRDRTIRLWTIPGTDSRVLRGADGRITSLAFGPGGELISGGAVLTEVRVDGEAYTRDGNADNVRVWDMKAGKQARVLDILGTTVAVLPGGKIAAAGIHPWHKADKKGLSLGGKDTITLADLKSGKTLVRVVGGGQQAWASANGRLLLTGGGHGPHLPGNILVGERCIGIGTSAKAKVTKVRIGPGKREANNVIGDGSDDTRLTLRDPATLKALKSFEEGFEVLAISPDGKEVAVGQHDGVVRFYALHLRAR